MRCSSMIPVRKVHTVQALPVGGTGIVQLALNCREAAPVRTRLRTGQTLFEIGSDAVSYFILTRGALTADFRAPGGCSTTILIAAGTMFSLACGEHYMARCVAAADSEVVRFNRNKFELLAHSRPELRSVVQSVHAQELSMVLAALRSDADRSMPVSEESVALADTGPPATRGADARVQSAGQADRWMAPSRRRTSTTTTTCDDLALA